jgi:hypothetical protein
MAIDPDFYVGEHGDELVVAMPYDASGESLVIEVQKPPPSLEEAEWSGGITITATSISRTVLDGELDVPGTYRCAVVCTRESPARVRRVRFELRVEDATPER